jgi:magnesium chelatase subunit D
MQRSFPFSAIVGQDTLKRALLLVVIQPSLGGVLIRGTKGVAKSTAVRALASLLPPIEVVVGCPFQRRPGEEIPDWPLPNDAAVAVRPLPLMELPLGATEDRLLGSLHLEKALRGERAFEPGLLAAANRGILYVDEVNLLPDHLVDVLLDAAASGWHRVEREGLSLSHPAHFVLIGTMNPEEGELRPQLLDRFGLVVDAPDLAEPTDRAEVVRRRLAYEADPRAFIAAWSDADAAEAARILRAQALLPQVQISDPLVRAVSERCLAAGVQGLRADLTLCKAACAWAAYQGRTEVEIADMDAVAALALGHRRTRPPEPPPEGPRSDHRGAPPRPLEEPGANHPPASTFAPPSAIFLSSAGLFAPRPRPSRQALAGASVEGRWCPGGAARRGRMLGPVASRYESGSRVAWAATLRAAAPYQMERRNAGDRQPLVLRAADVRIWPRHPPAGCLLLFLIDASGSMAAWKRMRQTKSAVLALLLQAYQRRDRIAFLVFRGRGAEIVLPPTRGLRTARRVLEELPVGGTTPLAQGLAAAARFLGQQRRRQPRQPIWTVLLTDGRANVARGTRDPWLDALAQARALRASATEFLVVDTETGWPRFGKAAELARALDAACLGVEEVLGPPVRDPYSLSAVG